MSGVRSSWTRHRSGRRADARLLGRGHSIALASAEGHHPNCMSDRRSHGRTDQAVILHSTRSYASSVRAPLSGRLSVRGPPAVGTTAVVGMDLTQHGLGALPGVRRTAAARPRVAPCVAGRTHLAVRTPPIGAVPSQIPPARAAHCAEGVPDDHHPCMRPARGGRRPARPTVRVAVTRRSSTVTANHSSTHGVHRDFKGVTGRARGRARSPQACPDSSRSGDALSSAGGEPEVTGACSSVTRRSETLGGDGHDRDCDRRPPDPRRPADRRARRN
jgi:hypothetical protein